MWRLSINTAIMEFDMRTKFINRSVQERIYDLDDLKRDRATAFFVISDLPLSGITCKVESFDGFMCRLIPSTPPSDDLRPYVYEEQKKRVRYWYFHNELKEMRERLQYNPIEVEVELAGQGKDINIQSILEALGRWDEVNRNFEDKLNLLGLGVLSDLYSDKPFTYEPIGADLVLARDEHNYRVNPPPGEQGVEIPLTKIIDLELIYSVMRPYSDEERECIINKVMLMQLPLRTYIAWFTHPDSMVEMQQGELVNVDFDADEITVYSRNYQKQSTHNIKGRMGRLHLRPGSGATGAVAAKDYTRDISTYFSKRPEQQWRLYETVRSSMKSAINTVGGYQRTLDPFMTRFTVSGYAIDTMSDNAVDHFLPDVD
jgi:hypothetical protein